MLAGWGQNKEGKGNVNVRMGWFNYYGRYWYFKSLIQWVWCLSKAGLVSSNSAKRQATSQDAWPVHRVRGHYPIGVGSEEAFSSLRLAPGRKTHRFFHKASEERPSALANLHRSKMTLGIIYSRVSWMGDAGAINENSTRI